MSQGYIVQIPQRILTANGGVGNGYLLYTYTVGTTTPKATYSDGQLTSLNTNPVVADANGRFRMFVAQGDSVKVVVHDASDVLVETFDYQQPMVSATAAGSVTAVPTGGILAYGAAAAPTGFLLCDGSPVSRSTNAALFAVVGTTFGAGDGSTTFNLPDLRQRFPLGKAAAGTGSTLGGTGGAIDHTHTGPSHTHVTTVPRNGWGFTANAPAVSGRIRTGDIAGTGTEANADQAANDIDVTSAAGGTGNTGTNNAPFQAVNFIIKT